MIDERRELPPNKKPNAVCGACGHEWRDTRPFTREQVKCPACGAWEVWEALTHWWDVRHYSKVNR